MLRLWCIGAVPGIDCFLYILYSGDYGLGVCFYTVLFGQAVFDGFGFVEVVCHDGPVHRLVCVVVVLVLLEYWDWDGDCGDGG